MPGRERKRLNSRRTNPLGEDLEADRYASLRANAAGVNNNNNNNIDDDDDDVIGGRRLRSTNNSNGGGGGLITNQATRRILRTARRQLEDVRDEVAYGHNNNNKGLHDNNDSSSSSSGDDDGDDNEEEEGSGGGRRKVRMDPELQAALDGAFGQPREYSDDEEAGGAGGGATSMSAALLRGGNTNENEDEEEEEEEEVELEFDDTESVVSEVPSELAAVVAAGGGAGVTGEEFYQMDEEEARLLQKFQPASRVQSRTLADMIMEKIREKEAETAAADDESATEGGGGGGGRNRRREDGVDPRVARVYAAVGTILKKYTSGKIPKAFKILPNVQNWEQLVMLTRPHEWSPHATYQATRIFASGLNERMAQRFYAMVFLPIVHQHMLEEHKLHPALYMAVRKALFKPVAFFKGFLLPLAMDEECTLREALVIASVLQRSHLPPVPTAVCIVKIAQMPFSGPCSVLLRVLIDKKMALPIQAIDALVAYFHRFVKSHPRGEPLPVLWHQTLLSFVQRYKADLAPAQLELLGQVCQTHFHYMITPEIRRELTAAQRAARGVA